MLQNQRRPVVAQAFRPAKGRRAALKGCATEDSATSRLWRLRKRQQSIDAILRDDVTLEFVMNGKRVTARHCASRAQAIKAATEKRKELERAGWATHW